MLSRLYIQNYALIDQLEISLHNGLVIITGETGAGKSILLGALNLILGNRADAQSLFDKNAKCIVEATFDLAGYNLKSFFETGELDYEDKTIIRREVNKDGKSRAFINDTPVTLNVLRDLTGQLVDIHSQRDSLALINAEYQMTVLDAFAGTNDLLIDFKSKLKHYKNAVADLSDLIEKEKQAKTNLDYLQFQVDELDAAMLQSGEEESSSQELGTLNNAEEIKLNLTKAFTAINNEQGVLSLLNEIYASLKTIVRFNSNYQQNADRISSVLIELKDIAAELENAEQEISLDPKRIEMLTERLNVVYKLQHKHHVKTVDELIALHEKFSDEIFSITSLDDRINELRLSVEKQKAELLSVAKSISKKRQSVIPSIEKKVQSLLRELAMPDARLKIELTQISNDTFNANGIDELQWLFSANKGHEFKPLSKVASGGELSRVMLCIKSMMAEVLQLPTMIFDEIDSGVSGEVAIKVGKMMHEIAAGHQVITITHLPQIAGKGNQHFYVYKDNSKQPTFTRVKELKEEERIIEIAKMIGGEKPSTAAFENAKEILNM